MADTTAQPSDWFRWLNVALLGLGWCLTMSGMFINISTTTVAATTWVNASVSTLPVGVQLIGAALSVVPLGRLALRVGRRMVFVGAALLAVVGSLVLVVAAWYELYGLLILGTFLQGPAFAVANNFRFVSAEFMTGKPATWRARAVSVTVGCAVFAAGIGPESVRNVRDNFAKPYAAAYVLVAGLYLGQALASSLVSYRWLTELQATATASTITTSPPAKQQQRLRPAATQQPSAGQDGSVTGPQDKGIEAVQIVLATTNADEATSTDDDSPGTTTTALTQQQGVVSADSGCHKPVTPLSAAFPGSVAQPGLGPEPKGWVRASLMRVEFFMPAVAGAISFCNMAALMVATPVMMKEDHHSYDQSTWTIEGHIAGMFLPAALVGDWMNLVRAMASLCPPLLQSVLLLLPFLPTRSTAAGAPRDSGLPPTGHMSASMVLGAGTMMVSAGVVLAGKSVGHYAPGLALLGVGWALAYVSSSAIVTGIFTREPHLRLVVQGGMDTLVVFASAIANATAGPLVRAMGRDPFVYLNLAANTALLLWCGAYHVISTTQWRRQQQQQKAKKQLPQQVTAAKHP